MLVTKISQLSGKEHTMDLDITEEQINAWRTGVLVQRAFPQLRDYEREFLITGMTPKEWDELVSFGE